MNILQTYETTIMGRTSDHAMHVVVVPSRSLPSLTQFPIDVVLDALELTKLASTDASHLAQHLAVLLAPNLPARELTQALASVAMGKTTEFNPSVDDVRFAEFVSFERVVPLEQSPLTLESLAKVLTSASGVGVGAYIGFVASGSTPLLLITVPAGMIICGAAGGIGRALEDGLRDRLVRWLKGYEAEASPTGKKKPSTSEMKAG